MYLDFDHKCQPPTSPNYNGFLTVYSSSPNDSLPEPDLFGPPYNNPTISDMGNMDTENVDPNFDLLFYQHPHGLSDLLYTRHTYSSSLGPVQSHAAPSALTQLQIPSCSPSTMKQPSASLDPNGNCSINISPYSCHTSTSESTLNTPMDSQTFPLPPPPQADCFYKEEFSGTPAVPSSYVTRDPTLPSPSAVTDDFSQCSLCRITPPQSSATYSETGMYSKPPGDWTSVQENAYDGYVDRFSQFHDHDISQPISQNVLSELPGGIAEAPPVGKALRQEVATERVVAHARSRRKDPSKKGQHICPICKRDFTAPHNLKHHINSHEGKKPYHCNSCGDSFTTPRSLKRHTATKHGDDKPTDQNIRPPCMTELKPEIVEDFSQDDRVFWVGYTSRL